MSIPKNTRQDLSIFQGETLVLRLTVVDASGTAIDLTGFTGDQIRFRIGTRNNENVISYTLANQITLITPASGIFEIEILDTDTDDLVPMQVYSHQTRIEDALGNVRIVLYGLLEVKNSLFV